VDATAIALIASAIFVWGALSARFQRADLTAPIAFLAVGAVLAGLDVIEASTASQGLRPLVEITLVWVLFSDAARVRVQDLRGDLALYGRLLGVGLPLTVLAGWGAALWLFPDLGVWLALLVAAALAPTDAALGVPVVTNPVVPSRIRRMITVESGLNDGIATPVVMLAIVGAASAEGFTGAPGLGEAVAELMLGAGVGVAVGAGGGWLLRRARRRDWSAEDFVGIAVLALALVAYAGAVALQGNGFVAAFVGGLAFGSAAGPRGRSEVTLVEQASGLMSLLVWLGFGAIAVPVVLAGPGVAAVLYAVLSLTVLRMVPVAVACLGSGLDRRTVLFVGWFGPRGLASLVFALLALEELGPVADGVVSVIGLTVFLSVLAHGASSAPLAAWYGRAVASREPEPGTAVPEIPVRGLPRRSRPVDELGADRPGP
jgi:sodium/hydrogen antiporter